jgi:hypothetical protein
MDTLDGLHLFPPGIVLDCRLQETLHRSMTRPSLAGLTRGSHPCCLLHNTCHAMCWYTKLYHVVLVQNSHILSLKACLVSDCRAHISLVHLSTWSDLRIVQGLDERGEDKKAIVSGSNIAAGHRYDLADMENMAWAIFPNVFLQVPVQSAGHKKTCLLLGKMCLTSHFFLPQSLLKPGEGPRPNLLQVLETLDKTSPLLRPPSSRYLADMPSVCFSTLSVNQRHFCPEVNVSESVVRS